MEMATQDTLERGIAAHEQGDLGGAEESYRNILSSNPDHAEANGFLGLLMASSGNGESAIPFLRAALQAKPWQQQFWLNLIDVLVREQYLAEAQIFITEARSHGVSEPELAIREFELLQGLITDNLDKWEGQGGGTNSPTESMGLALDDRPMSGGGPEALEQRDKVMPSELSLERATALVHLIENSQFNEAELEAKSIIKEFPQSPMGWKALGVIAKFLGKFTEAVEANEQALRLSPSDHEVLNNLGDTLNVLGRLDSSEQNLKQAIALKPDFAEAHSNLGLTLHRLGRFADAEDSYAVATTLKPDYAQARHNLAITLQAVDRLAEAESSSRLALVLNSDFPEAHNTLGVTLQYQGRLEEAIASFERAVSLEPGYAVAESQLIHQKRHICDFSVAETLFEASSRLGIAGATIPPFIALTWSDDPEQNFLRAKAYAAEKYSQQSEPPPVMPSDVSGRLKIGYFSADFHNFPGMYLMAGLLESHDRERFEVFAFSYGPDKDDAMRRRIVEAVDHFIDIKDMSTKEIVQLSRDHGIDIAIHRNGYTTNARTELFQNRLSPIQISYLGYPGTLGADFIDYLVADPIVIPEEQREFYAEKIMYLPDTYQPNDNTREIAETKTTRADFNLPEEAFVFCCFNQNYKISPQEFDIWMRVLGKVEGSVLWLLKSNKWAEANLLSEAEGRGIDPSRLVFAERLPQSEHLARHKHADLFLDTFNYNAHTTASDALWAGLPVVTKQGKQFAARVGASLLTAVGLPELITESEDDYERLILDLATDDQKLALVKDNLIANRLSAPLFDTQRYARNLEAGFFRAYDAYHENNEVSEIWV